ncbi:hypothetical protein Tco_1066763 [Tanacetum coccineum]|uniref:Uncharacterized protein n=1 Tax=Tanacetum coccineum TaxID=301880 RepID=A0ABQ5HCC5_9ASTR
MKKDIAKQTAHDEKLVPREDRVPIRESNLRISPSITQREETFQVVLDILKNIPFYNAFITLLMFQKSTCSNFGSRFRKEILDISPIDENEEFVIPHSSAELRDFVSELGYKGTLTSSLDLFVDHMHQPWRTFAAIINKCLSGKTSSNDRLRPSRIEIL